MEESCYHEERAISGVIPIHVAVLRMLKLEGVWTASQNDCALQSVRFSSAMPLALLSNNYQTNGPTHVKTIPQVLPMQEGYCVNARHRPGVSLRRGSTPG